MPRSISTLARSALNAQQTGEAFILLLGITAPDIVGVIRLARDSRDLVSRGNTYQRFPFDVEFPGESEDAPPVIRLAIANADRRIVEAIRLTPGPILVVLEAVMASTPDIVEAGPFEFTLRNVDYDADQVSGSLHFEDLMNEPYPGASFTPALFPGLG